jgi:diguanylate cyclase (GGDEF)-like protein
MASPESHARGRRRRPDAADAEAKLRELEARLESQAQRIAWLERALERAQRDALTGLSGHGQFWAALEVEVARASRHGRALGLVMLDVDELKRRNDERGHLAGDRALMAVARRIQERCRASDLAARYGGDEFAVILPETDLSGALVFAEELGRRIEKAEGLQVSAGAAAFPEHGPDARALVAAADAALYRSKAAGRARACAAPRDPR